MHKRTSRKEILLASGNKIEIFHLFLRIKKAFMPARVIYSFIRLKTN